MERIIGIIKAAIRKLLTLFPGSFWDEHLFGIIAALRMIPTRSHGYSAFELVYKQVPEFPAHIYLPADTRFDGFWASEEEEAKMADKIIEMWLSIRPGVMGRLQRYDDKMRERYADAMALLELGVENVFGNGDAVMMK